MKPEEIKHGKLYRGHRRRETLFTGKFDDRRVVWIKKDRSQVQYDSYFVKMGQRLPRIPMEQFAKWAKEEVVESAVL